MLKLYTSPGACSTACHIALQEAGIPFETKILEMGGEFMNSPAFLAINPKAYVPFLELSGNRNLAEGAAIMQYIAEQVPEKNFFPAKGFEKFQAMEWMNYIASELHKSVGFLFGVGNFITNPEAVTEFTTKWKTENLFPKFDYINKTLQGRDFMMGAQYTFVDSYLFTIMSWCKPLKIDLSQWENIVKFQNRVYERPATQRALKAEGLLK